MATDKTLKGRIYLFAYLGKAWIEVSFTEVLAEAIGGLVLAVVAYFKGWIDQGSAFEIALECAGCAFLVPLIAFILRAFFVAPGELVKETEESKKKIEINPKSVFPSIIATLLAICSVLIVCLGFSIKWNVQHRMEKPHSSEAVNQKPLAPKTIPTNEFSPANISAPPPVATNPVSPVETFGVPTGDVEDAESVFAKNRAQKEDDAKKQNRQEQEWWAGELEYYNHALVVLHDKLLEKATSVGDRLIQSTNYFKCLPPIIDPQTGEAAVAKIGFEKNPDWDFLITVTGKNEADRRNLRISCGGGFMEIHADPQNLGTKISIPSGFHSEDPVVPLQQAKSLIDSKIPFLIRGQEHYLRQAHK